MIIRQAVILAGGFGKRLGDKSFNCPKPMQLINNEPFLNNIIWNLKRHDINDLILSIGYLAKNFKDYYGNGYNFGVNISYVEEKTPAGKLFREGYRGSRRAGARSPSPGYVYWWQ